MSNEFVPSIVDLLEEINKTPKKENPLKFSHKDCKPNLFYIDPTYNLLS